MADETRVQTTEELAGALVGAIAKETMGNQLAAIVELQARVQACQIQEQRLTQDLTEARERIAELEKLYADVRHAYQAAVVPRKTEEARNAPADDSRDTGESSVPPAA